jgi:hypothetical protein
LLVELGSIVALLGAGLLAAGGALVWADRTQRGDDGFLTTPTERFEQDSNAIVSGNIDLFEAETGSDWILSDGVLGDVRLHSENVEDSETFVGMGSHLRRGALPRRRRPRRGDRPRLRSVRGEVPEDRGRRAGRAAGGADVLGGVGGRSRRADRDVGARVRATCRSSS